MNKTYAETKRNVEEYPEYRFLCGFECAAGTRASIKAPRRGLKSGGALSEKILWKWKGEEEIGVMEERKEGRREEKSCSRFSVKFFSK